MNPTFNKLIVKEVRKETDECVSIAFNIEDAIKSHYEFKPGQYLTLRTDIDGEDVRRSYSICAGLNDGELRVAVKKVPFGKFSSFANDSIQAGDELLVMTPMGTFTTDFDLATEKSFVFFAAGSGITPVLSLIKSILETSPKSDITLFYGNKGFETIIFREALENLKSTYLNRFSLIHIFSEENTGNPLQNGIFDKEKVDLLHKAFLETQEVDEIFICGPEPIIHTISDFYSSKGLSKDQIHFELFTSPTQKKSFDDTASKPEKQINANVKIILDGEETLISLDSDGESILEAGYKAGADLPFACKGGVCCTCKAKVLEGSASMDVNYALEKDEVEAGYILTCQAHPTSDKIVVSFDD